MRVLAVCVLTLFAIPVTSLAQQPVAVAKEAAPPLTVPPGEFEVPKLVELVGRYAQCNILWDAAEVSGAKPIVLTEPVKLDRSSCLTR